MKPRANALITLRIMGTGCATPNFVRRVFAPRAESSSVDGRFSRTTGRGRPSTTDGRPRPRLRARPRKSTIDRDSLGAPRNPVVRPTRKSISLQNTDTVRPAAGSLPAIPGHRGRRHAEVLHRAIHQIHHGFAGELRRAIERDPVRDLHVPAAGLHAER